jgi:hypothetical protein
MHRYVVTISTKGPHTRLLLTSGPDELMRATLPPSGNVYYERAVTNFLEGLSMWLDHKLHVVLSVDASEASYCLGLTDNLGIGVRHLFFDVDVKMHQSRRRRGTRIRGVGDFSDVRGLLLHGSENL